MFIHLHEYFLIRKQSLYIVVSYTNKAIKTVNEKLVYDKPIVKYCHKV